MNEFRKIVPYLVGVVVAGLFFVLPESRSIACGAGSVLPLLGV